jgi:hypothetical protein
MTPFFSFLLEANDLSSLEVKGMKSVGKTILPTG